MERGHQIGLVACRMNSELGLAYHQARGQLIHALGARPSQGQGALRRGDSVGLVTHLHSQGREIHGQDRGRAAAAVTRLRKRQRANQVRSGRSVVA